MTILSLVLCIIMKSLIFLLVCKGCAKGKTYPYFCFLIFLNDLEDYFEELNALPLGTITEKIQNTLHTFIQIFVLLYADDTVIFYESLIEGMQKALDTLQEYCNLWK